VQRAKKRGLTIVTSNGCFDILHIGHLRNLEYAKRHGDILIVGINSDNSVKRIKGPQRPIVPSEERAAMLAALKPVDAVFIYNEDTPEKWLAKLAPNVHVKGADRREREIPEKKIVLEGGGRLVLAPITKSRSTSALISRIRSLK